jgi:hypothetical protein
VPDEEDAEAALALLKDRIVEFPFVDDVSRAVGLSAIISCAGASPPPVHLVDAPGLTGKATYSVCESWIATGQAMPALGRMVRKSWTSGSTQRCSGRQSIASTM